jgi:hypothetical protein
MAREVGMKCTDEMLQAAVKKAVEVGLLPKHGFDDQVAQNWVNMKAVVEAALEAAPRVAG